MGRISAGLDFGQATTQPVRVQAVDPAAGAAPSIRALDVAGARMVADGEQMAREEARAAAEGERESRIARERADVAVANARLANLRDAVADEVDRIGVEVQEGRLQKTDAMKAWQDRSAKLLDESIEAVPEAHREQVRVDIQSLSGRLASRVGDIVRRRDQQDTRSALDQMVEHTQRLAVSDPAKARELLFANMDQLGPFAGLSPEQISKAKQGWVEGVAYTRAFTAVNAAKGDNRALAAVEQGLSLNDEVDPQRKAQLLAQVDGYKAANEARALRQAQHAEILAQRRQRESDEAYGILSGWALAGKAADSAASAALIGKLTPAAAAAYRGLAAEIPARTAVAMLPLDVQAQQLDQLKARAVTGTSQDLEREIKRREDVLGQARREYADDPLRAANERGILPAPLRPLDMSSLDAVAMGLGERSAQAQAVSIITRAPVSPLLPEEAKRLGDVLDALPVGERGRRIAQMAGVLPAPMMLAMAQQIGGDDKGGRRALALEMQFGADRTTSGRYRSELIARGAQVVKEKGVKEETAAEFGLRAQIAKEIGDALPPKWRVDAIEAARLMYLGQQAEGGSPSVAGVVRLAAGGELVEHNGRRIPLLAGVNEGKLQDTLRAYPAASLQSQAPGGVVMLPGGKPIPVAEFLVSLPEAQLEPVAPGRYGVRAGAGIVMGQNNRPIIIEVR